MGRKAKYPWDRILDGGVWEMEIADLPVSVSSFRYTARQAAQRRGWEGVSVVIVGRLNDYIQIRATGPTPPQYQDLDQEPVDALIE